MRWNMKSFANSWQAEYWTLTIGHTVRNDTRSVSDSSDKTVSTVSPFTLLLLWLSLMHFVSERLDFFFSFRLNFRFQLVSFGLGNSTNQCRPLFSSLAALHSRFLSSHSDTRFLFLPILPSLFSYFLPSQITSQPPRNRQTLTQAQLHFWQNFKRFLPSSPFSCYIFTFVTVRILFNLAPECIPIQLQSHTQPLFLPNEGVVEYLRN